MSESRSSALHGSKRLAARRRLRRRRALIALGILVLMASTGAIYELRQGSTRISHVEIYGADQSYAAIATAAMQGTYLGIIPRDSTFFYPASSIRSGIIAAHPDVAAVALFRNGRTGLSIRVDERAPIARWCGASPSGLATSTPPVPGDCYLFDASGFVYGTSSASSPDSPQAAQPINAFVVYEPPASAGDPIGSTLPNAAAFPAAFDFARELTTFGSPVTQVVIRGDEVDDYLASGTRITYVLGSEQSAYAALSSAQSDFNLANGSVDYIDLRFGGKVYLKKKAVNSKQ